MKNNVSQHLPETENHVNGWPVIRHFLDLNRTTQSALAAHLRISPSAVSQIKQGLFLLNAEQLRATVRFLKMDQEGLTAFYTQVFRGRLLAEDDRGEADFSISISHGQICRAPEASLCMLEWLEMYEPVTEPLTSYLAKWGIGDMEPLYIQWSADRSPAGVSGGGNLRLRYKDSPVPGDIVLMKCRGLPCRITQFRSWSHTGGNFTDLIAGAPEKHILFAGITWLFPAADLRLIP
ncbi:MAG: hypothetical protein J6S73_09845 [Lentisphaeria bacterium]|nr:hypothetical protein [Lentisphaeria bacterium]